MDKKIFIYEPIIDELLLEIRNPWWMQSEYGSSDLFAQFDTPIKISFNITLANNKLLTSIDSRKLLEEIYDFLLLQSHPRIYGHRKRTPLTDRRHFLRATHIIDHLLLNDTGKIARHGLGTVGTKELSYMMLSISKTHYSEEGLYDWHNLLSNYLRDKINTVTESEINYAQKHHPSIFTTNNIDISTLGFDANALVKARIFILISTMKLKGAKSWSPRLYAAANAELKRTLYKNTLLGPGGYLIGLRFPKELTWQSNDINTREFRGQNVAAGWDTSSCSKKRFEEYRTCLLSSKVLSEINYGFSINVLQDVEKINFSQVIEFKEKLGFKHVPPPVISEVLRQAIKFFYDHHFHLIESFKSVVVQNIFTEKELIKIINHKTISMGVSQWCTRNTENISYAESLRGKNKGLWDMLQVLYGAALIIVGVCQAARQGELLDIKAEDLNKKDNWLALLSRKTGFQGQRHKHYRPIPKVAADVIKSLSRISKILNKENSYIFAIPTIKLTLQVSPTTSNAAIDTFLDFIQSPKDDLGNRYYLRQHQLRKFFASVYFYACTFSGLDSLRWFLRHVDINHLWNYIHGIIPGNELRHHMASAGALLLRDGDKELHSLSIFLKKNLNISDLVILNNAELETILEDLQLEGKIKFRLLFYPEDKNPIRLGVIVTED